MDALHCSVQDDLKQLQKVSEAVSRSSWSVRYQSNAFDESRTAGMTRGRQGPAHAFRSGGRYSINLSTWSLAFHCATLAGIKRREIRLEYRNKSWTDRRSYIVAFCRYSDRERHHDAPLTLCFLFDHQQRNLDSTPCNLHRTIWSFCRGRKSNSRTMV